MKGVVPFVRRRATVVHVELGPRDFGLLLRGRAVEGEGRQLGKLVPVRVTLKKLEECRVLAAVEGALRRDEQGG